MVEAATTRTQFTKPESILGESERASIEMAFRAITSGLAFQLKSESEFGSLEVGRLADFVVLADDPPFVDPSDLAEIQILQTWMDGARVR